MRAAIVLLRRPPAMISRQANHIDLSKVGGQVTNDERIKLPRRQAVMEHVSEVGIFHVPVNFPTHVIPVHQNP